MNWEGVESPKSFVTSVFVEKGKQTEGTLYMIIHV